ncbi:MULTISPECIES: 5'-nucleotidase, lipoprotein e(P4) family [Sphingomonas]|uniref:5'-nucleotidase (Lipoprotein e(P4) family) n=1 Tax=Sphingomonas trueperi TaxID=53317 RepID=A0A7X6BCF0_9SPHN|nr:HAD family acid phosphatase [Sphingomonas sp. ABOLD]NJB96587.1 5'-nucleotidase (lipoprotein e(P4) family) [Sphingomonas trueperi]
MIRGGLLLAAGLALSGCVVDTHVVQAPQAPAAASGGVPGGMQYLYGSGEAAALSVQAYNALVDQTRARMARRGGLSVVLEPGATLAGPRFQPCGDKPPAAVFDVDETLLLNLGYEGDDAQRSGGWDSARWDRWEKTGAMKVAAVPGALDAVQALRAMGVTVIFNTNRAAANAEQTEAALTFAGLGPAKHGETLFLKGDVDGKSGKDGRRDAIAQRWCVVAMGGDQLGDFTDLFAGLTPPERRAAAASPAIAALWGHGWFVLPNPVYGTGLGSTYDQTFPPATRWTDPQEKH